MKLRMVLALVVLMLTSGQHAQALHDCGPSKTLEEWGRESDVVLLGEFIAEELLGLERCEGGVLKEPVIGECLRGHLLRTRVKVTEVLKGTAGDELEVLVGVGGLNVGNCPMRDVVLGIPVILAIKKQADNLRVSGDQEGMLYVDPFEARARAKAVHDSVGE